MRPIAIVTLTNIAYLELAALMSVRPMTIVSKNMANTLRATLELAPMRRARHMQSVMADIAMKMGFATRVTSVRIITTL